MAEPIVFIDTNILLDAYRSRNDIGLLLIERLEGVQKHIITTYQVEMEFLKNRQSAILESLGNMKPPEQSVTAPAFLSQAKTVEMIGKNTKDTKKRISELKKRIENILAKPSTHDPVFKVANKIFNSESPLRLARSDKRKVDIRRRALRRFLLGYPPRKKNDTSTGDGVNWEWIVDCVSSTNRNVIIVSRDADFGCSIGNTSFPNDWLVKELKERTKQTRTITLTPKLSVALNKLKVKVTKEEKDEESQNIQERVRALQEKWSSVRFTDEETERMNNALAQLRNKLSHIFEMPDEDENG